MIAVKHLQVLAAVIRLGSVPGAARELNLTRPTVSKTFRRLEDITGTQLFRRSEGRLMPTLKAFVQAHTITGENGV